MTSTPSHWGGGSAGPPTRLDELAIEERGDLTRETHHREEIDAVARGCHVEHLLPDRQHIVRAACPGSSPSSSSMIPEWSEPSPTSSSARIIPRETSPRSFASPSVNASPSFGSSRAGQGDRDRRTGAEVPGAAHDLLRVGVADVDLAELQPVGIRVLLGRDHAADDQVVEIAVGVAGRRPR